MKKGSENLRNLVRERERENSWMVVQLVEKQVVPYL